MNIRTKRLLLNTEIRRVCIEQNYYTNGTNEEYEKMFDLARKNNSNITDEILYDIAKDIAEHSEMREDFNNHKEFIQSIMYYLNKASATFFNFDM